VVRLEPIVLEIESATTPLFIVAHEEHCRSLRAFMLRNLALQHERREDLDESFTTAPLSVLDFHDTKWKGFVETVVELA
jgi:hypothetical protein